MADTVAIALGFAVISTLAADIAALIPQPAH